jgi:hypothetical protein
LEAVVNPSLGIALSNAWARMVRMLFRPFRIDVWITVGFAAFLSELGSHGWGNGSSYSDKDGVSERAFQPVIDFLTNPAMIAIIVAIAACLFVLVIVLLWVSCRGRFIYLDCVVRERAAIVEPWKRYARQGNSLFLWSICFLLVVILAVMAATVPFIPRFTGLSLHHFPSEDQLRGFGLWFLLILPIALATGYVHIWTNHFVVPVMYRHGLTAMEGWGRFWTLLREHAGSFLLYGIVMMGLWFATMFLYFLAGFLTCCVGFIILALPYIGTIAMLPPLTLFRGFGPEYLRQFGPEWSAFDAPAAPAPPAGAPA